MRNGEGYVIIENEHNLVVGIFEEGGKT